MHARLKNIYFMLAAPAAAGFIAVAVVRQMQPLPVLPDPLAAVVAPAIFILAAVFAVAGPILIRTLFAHGRRDARRISRAELFAFERRTILAAMPATYLALAAYALQLPRFHLAGTLLMALYAVYYAYPSIRRVTLDERIYRAAADAGAHRIQAVEKQSSRPCLH
jgi:hypothetical protein